MLTKKQQLPGRNPAASNKKEPLPPLHSSPTDWVDKQDIMECFHISSRSLQNMRTRKEITWSTIGGKIYYHLPSFTALLERNRRS